MTTTMPAPTTTMLAYREQGEIDYARLDYNPDELVLKPEAMEQEQPIQHLIGLLASRFTDFDRRPDTFLSSNTIICYDRRNLNVRVSPDVYLAFGVEAHTIRSRKLYLPWEVGKPPDWVLEVASSSTGPEDVGRKRDLYARIGVPEYWRFDPKDGKYHGQRLAGDRLVAGAYEPIELTTAPDGILKGHSEILGLSLCWDAGWPRLYDPGHGQLPGELAGSMGGPVSLPNSARPRPNSMLLRPKPARLRLKPARPRPKLTRLRLKPARPRPKLTRLPSEIDGAPPSPSCSGSGSSFAGGKRTR